VEATPSFLALATSGWSGEAAAHEPRGERALSSVYLGEKGTGEMMILHVSGLIASLQRQKMEGPSRFCDVCGHKTPAPEVKCNNCPCTFHKACLGLQPLDEVTDDWICHACKRLSIEQAKQSGESTELLPMAETARTRWKPPDTPMQCSSCGYHETEAMSCDSCSRWFCFACMCLSAETLPANTWSCPECIGQDRYDEGHRVLIEASFVV
jgi:hypothetical protein